MRKTGTQAARKTKVIGSYGMVGWRGIVTLLAITFLVFFIESDGVSLSPNGLEVIVLQDIDSDRSNKKAIIILPGLGDSKKGRAQQKKFFSNRGYDLFIPDYIASKSYTKTLEAFSQFVERQSIWEYKEVHVFAYLLGGWIINDYMLEHGKGNFARVVYDRSPLQERAPLVMRDRMPLVAKLKFGDLIAHFFESDRPVVFFDDLDVGVIVETRATLLIRVFRETTMGYGPIYWRDLDFGRNFDDMIFYYLDHDEMYTSFDIVGKEILHFFAYGEFSDYGRREWGGRNPFAWK